MIAQMANRPVDPNARQIFMGGQFYSGGALERMQRWTGNKPQYPILSFFWYLARCRWAECVDGGTVFH